MLIGVLVLAWGITRCTEALWNRKPLLIAPNAIPGELVEVGLHTFLHWVPNVVHPVIEVVFMQRVICAGRLTALISNCGVCILVRLIPHFFVAWRPMPEHLLHLSTVGIKSVADHL